MAKKTKKRHLVLEIVAKGTKRSLRVKTQTHRGENFCVDGQQFVASNDFVLSSYSAPEFSGGTELYVRGEDADEDALLIDCPNERELKQLKLAVAEYNESGGGEEYPTVIGTIE